MFNFNVRRCLNNSFEYNKSKITWFWCSSFQFGAICKVENKTKTGLYKVQCKRKHKTCKMKKILRKNLCQVQDKEGIPIFLTEKLLPENHSFSAHTSESEKQEYLCILDQAKGFKDTVVKSKTPL